MGRSSPLLDNVLKLILHSRDVILPFDGFLSDISLAELDLSGIALTMSNLNASLLCGRARQFLDKSC